MLKNYMTQVFDIVMAIDISIGSDSPSGPAFFVVDVFSDGVIDILVSVVIELLLHVHDFLGSNTNLVKHNVSFSTNRGKLFQDVVLIANEALGFKNLR